MRVDLENYLEIIRCCDSNLEDRIQNHTSSESAPSWREPCSLRRRLETSVATTKWHSCEENGKNGTASKNASSCNVHNSSDLTI